MVMVAMGNSVRGLLFELVLDGGGEGLLWDRRLILCNVWVQLEAIYEHLKLLFLHSSRLSL